MYTGYCSNKQPSAYGFAKLVTDLRKPVVKKTGCRITISSLDGIKWNTAVMGKPLPAKEGTGPLTAI